MAPRHASIRTSGASWTRARRGGADVRTSAAALRRCRPA